MKDKEREDDSEIDGQVGQHNEVDWDSACLGQLWENKKEQNKLEGQLTEGVDWHMMMMNSWPLLCLAAPRSSLSFGFLLY